jgi:hexosaminidase
MQYNIIPYPQELTPKEGTFTFNKRTVIVCPTNEPEIQKLALQFAEQFKRVSGISIVVKSIEKVKKNEQVFVFQKALLENDEAYKLQISPNAIRVEARTPNGFFYALQTLYQLLPTDIYGKNKSKIRKWSAPCVSISDAPRFAYRGLHLDVGRHFFPIDFIKKYIDAMAFHKLNNFHWHLTEDQGWRLEIKKYPLLTEIGSKRKETLIGNFFERFPQQFDGKPYGGFYTQDEAREIVAYAAERFINVIPEIELPGHAQAALASYPFLSCTQDTTIEVATRWGIFKDVYCPRESTFTFLEDVLTEVLDIFPSKYIHIGGDECPKDRWKECPDCQSLIKKLNLKDEHELQSYFVQRIERFLNSKGRKIIGWDEILEGGLAPNATVMSWRGTNGGIAAAKAGHDVIMNPRTHCYFDYYQSDPMNEPTAIGGYLPLNKVYHYEPVPAELTSDEAKYILGAQANVWTEYIPTSQHVEYMTFPRVSAMSEVLWSSTKNWESFSKRLLTQFERYSTLGIHFSKAFYDVQFKPELTSENKMKVTLSVDYPDAPIYYTTNGQAPTPKDALYVLPLVFDQSVTLTAATFVDGKMQKPITKSYSVNKLTGLEYTQNLKNTWFDGGAKFALTDGIFGNNKLYSEWMGIGGNMDAEITVDMKEMKPIERFSVGLISIPGLCVQHPTQIQLFCSTDDAEYTLIAEKQIVPSDLPTWEIIRPELVFPKTETRFLKLKLKNSGVCPAGRPSGSMIFMDEIEAW